MKISHYGDELKVSTLLPRDKPHVQTIFSEARRIELLSAGITLHEDPKFLVDSYAQVAVARLDAEVAGFVEYSTSEILRLYVDPLHQGKGVSSRLLRYALQHMLGSVNAEVLAGSELALTLFFRYGFEVLRPLTIEILETKTVARGYLLQLRGSTRSNQTYS